VNGTTAAVRVLLVSGEDATSDRVLAGLPAGTELTRVGLLGDALALLG
jgi:hypothetical protein